MKHKIMEILFYWGSNQALIYKEIEWAIMLDVQELYQKHKHKPKKKKKLLQIFCHCFGESGNFYKC